MHASVCSALHRCMFSHSPNIVCSMQCYKRTQSLFCNIKQKHSMYAKPFLRFQVINKTHDIFKDMFVGTLKGPVRYM